MKVQLLLGSTAAILVHGQINDGSGEEPLRRRLQNSTVRGNNENHRDLVAMVRSSTPLDGVRATKVDQSTNAKEATTASAANQQKKDRAAKTGKDRDSDDTGSKTGTAPASMPINGSKPSSKSKSSKRDPAAGSSPAPDSKSSKRGGSDGKSGKATDAYYIGPISCPNHCVDVSGVNFMTGLLNNAIKTCDNQSQDQKWIVHNDDTFVKLESHSYPNMCIQVENQSTCVGGTLVLGDCSDHESMWYFTGGQLISAYCWVQGQTNVMGVNYNEDKRSCDAALNAYGGANSQVIRADMFMFIDERMIQGDNNAGTSPPTISVSYFPTKSPTLYPSYFPTAAPV